MENLNINDVKPGMVLLDKTHNKKYIVIETLLNGNDDYYSSLRIITEGEYLENIGKRISEDKLKTSEWIEMSEYHSDYENCKEKYEINKEIIFRF